MVMSQASDSIERAAQTWLRTKDALAIVRREVYNQKKGKNSGALLAHSSFYELSTDEAQEHLENCQQANSEFAILAMWAIFERQLFARLEHECRKMQGNSPTELNSAVFKKIIDAIEYWRIDDALDLVKPLVGSTLAGDTKNIKRYRDWIVHRNPRKEQPPIVDPETAKQILMRITELLHNN